MAVSLALAVPASAYAATGDFDYQGPRRPAVIYNPENGKCYENEDSETGRMAHNGTDAPVMLYANGNCQGDSVQVAANATNDDFSFLSVKFLNPAG
ncbi:hypothetical protein ACFWXK_37815 [Streptomyces sp. NPDC059070]|uniref:hypothetical protein n=1 Tax=Streptomyces sp. NPDC059070 TaxID=3346713 RepID=UPI00369B047E